MPCSFSSASSKIMESPSLFARSNSRLSTDSARLILFPLVAMIQVVYTSWTTWMLSSCRCALLCRKSAPPSRSHILIVIWNTKKIMSSVTQFKNCSTDIPLRRSSHAQRCESSSLGLTNRYSYASTIKADGDVFNYSEDVAQLFPIRMETQIVRKVKQEFK
jgi:hypothetical protein